MHYAPCALPVCVGAAATGKNPADISIGHTRLQPGRFPRDADQPARAGLVDYWDSSSRRLSNTPLEIRPTGDDPSDVDSKVHARIGSR